MGRTVRGRRAARRLISPCRAVDRTAPSLGERSTGSWRIGRVAIEGIVGTSAGAMNAVVTAYGLTLGGNEGAAVRWRASGGRSPEGAWSIMQPSLLDRLIKSGQPGLFAWLGVDGYSCRGCGRPIR